MRGRVLVCRLWGVKTALALAWRSVAFVYVSVALAWRWRRVSVPLSMAFVTLGCLRDVSMVFVTLGVFT